MSIANCVCIVVFAVICNFSEASTGVLRADDTSLPFRTKPLFGAGALTRPQRRWRSSHLAPHHGKAPLLAHHARRTERDEEKAAPASDVARNATSAGKVEVADDATHDDHDAGGAAEDAAEAAADHLKHATAKVREVPQRMPAEAGADHERFRNVFLPGWQISRRRLQMIFATIAVTLTWFLFYFSRVCQSDALIQGKNESSSNLAAHSALDEESISFLDLKNFADGPEPDIVIVVPHPSHPRDEDQDVSISQQTLGNLITSTVAGVKVGLDNVKALVDAQNGKDVLLGEARAALIKDLCEILPRLGFTCTVCLGTGGKNVFLCVSLVNPEWIENYLLWQRRQLQIRSEVVDALGLGAVDDGVASPPHLAFDPWLVERACDAKLIPENKAENLYVMSHAASYFDNVDDASRVDCIRIIFQQITACLDMDAACRHKIMSDWYPSHDLQGLRHLATKWASPYRVADLQFSQPMTLMNKYFGSRVAFNFAWVGLYCKALLALLPAAICWEILANYFMFPMVLAASIGIILWAKIATNLWEKEEQYLTELWETNDDIHDSIIRPQFHGEMRPSPIDGNVMELHCPRMQLFGRWAVSATVTTFFCFLVLLCIFTWNSIFDGRMDTFASICLVIMIKLFEHVYNGIVEFLTDWENHKYEPQHYNSYLFKQVTFSLVNNYSAFFYIAIKQQYSTEGCEGGCRQLLRKQLVTSLVLLSVLRILEVIVQTFRLRYTLYRHHERIKKELGREPDNMCFTEAQEKFGKFGLQEQVQMMLQLVIALGFIILFGGVAPIIVPFCLAEFVVQLRATAFLLVTTTKRTFPRRAFGIGAFRRVMVVLRTAGAIFAGYLLVLYSEVFEGVPMISRVTGMFCFCLLVGVLWGFVDMACPPTSNEADLLDRRRNRVKDRLFETCAQASHAQKVSILTPRDGGRGELLQIGADCSTDSVDKTSSAKAGAGGRWDDLPSFAELTARAAARAQEPAMPA